MIDAFKVQVRTVPASGACLVRRPGDTADRRVWITRATATAAVNDWMLVLAAGGVWWGIALLGATGAMPDPEQPPPPPDPSGPVTIEVPPAWIGARAWRPHTGSPGTPYVFRSVPSETFGYIGNRQDFSIAVPNPNPSTRWETMACFTGLTGINATSITIDWQLYLAAIGSQPDVSVTLWSLPAARPAGQNGHPAGLTLLAETSVGTIANGQRFTVTVPPGWRSQLISGAANGIGLSLPKTSPIQYFFQPSATPYAMKVTYEA